MTVFVAAAALIDQQKKILVGKRPAHKPLPNLWEFPGGKMEADESPEYALIRELTEELGIDVAADDLKPLTFISHQYDTFHLVMFLYTLHQWKGDVLPAEQQELKWVSIDDLKKLDMPPADLPMISSLQRYLQEITD